MKSFDQDVANNYDSDIRSRIPGYDHIQELISAVLDVEVPSPARMLVIGAGTGEEIRRTARRHPNWTIHGVEPSAEMNEIAKEKIRLLKFENQIHWHETKIEDFQASEEFDVALAVFVSHFIPDNGAKKAFFQKIADQLHPGAPLILVDFMKQDDLVGEKLIACNYFWAKSKGLELDKLHQLPTRLRNLFHPISEERLEELLGEVGLNLEGRFMQSLGFCGYVARKFELTVKNHNASLQS
ncbi:MAG: class I SAM-dependent methyltransferase [Bdellovibrio sp.]|nr:class I SAM-dependent methyltransferase [Bdellovibrio sp.]